MSAVDIKAMTLACDKLFRDPKVKRSNPEGYFNSLNALEQRRALLYYMADHKDAMQEAVNDYINWTDLERAWQAADTALVWHLIDESLRKGLADRIDEEHAQENAA